MKICMVFPCISFRMGQLIVVDGCGLGKWYPEI